jgi:hypothetical protein
MFGRSLFVLLSFYFRPFYCLSFDLQFLITPLTSSNFSYIENCSWMIWGVSSRVIDLKVSILQSWICQIFIQVYILFVWYNWCISYLYDTTGVYLICMIPLVYIIFVWYHWCISYLYDTTGGLGNISLHLSLSNTVLEFSQISQFTIQTHQSFCNRSIYPVSYF